MLGVRVDCDRPTGRLADHLGDERDARTATDQQHPVDVLEAEPRASRGTPERLDRLVDARSDRVLELGSGEAQLGLDAGQEDRDRGIGVGRQRFLGPTALLAQPGERGERRRIVGVDLYALCGDQPHHPSEEGLVEVDAPESLQALRLAERLEPVLGLAQDRRVEGAATEVVDRDDAADRYPLLAGVVQRRGLGLGQELDRPDVGLADRLLEQVELVRAVARGMAQRDRRRRLTRLLATRATIDRSRWARSASAPYGVPPRMIGVGSPRRRLNSRPVRVGSASARRSAASPVRTSPSSRKSTIDGIVAARSPSWKISSRSPRAIAAAE